MNQEIIINLRKIFRVLNLESKRIQKAYGISIPQLMTLQFLSKQEGFVSNQVRIKEYLSLNASTVTGIVGRLEHKGYVAKMPKNGDKRMNVVVLTEVGLKVLKSAPPLLNQLLRDELSKLPDGQMNQLRNSISLLTKIMRAEDIEIESIADVSDELI
jgi:DNA-binding MarR family transcriptional regulator